MDCDFEFFLPDPGNVWNRSLRYSKNLGTSGTITFFSGIQLIALGLLGEYIGRIYDEVKNRPQYIIDKKINFNED